jgi:hypothetical protein|tara:strand:+ start:743 stop:2434 length:1692 start_codon:yes stop_codon:yes gene_type:complete
MTIDRIYSNHKARIVLSLVGLLAVLLLLNFKTLYWPFAIIDSPILLAQAIAYSPLQYFTSPFEYQFLTYNNFTPWVILSWDIDYSLFQLEPWGYRAHQLASTVALIGVAYLLLYTLTRSAFNAAIFSFAIISLPATFGVLDDLVSRHYLEGMIFSLLSVFLAAMYNSKQKIVWLMLSVLLYAFSITAKEVFIPLPGILFFFFLGSFRRKVHLIIPYALTLVGYLIWRIYMLSGAGGYTSPEASISLFENVDLVVGIAQKLGGLLFVTPLASLAVLALFVVLSAASFRALSLNTKLGLLVGSMGLALPLVALLPLLSAEIFSPRWLFAPSIGLVIFLAYLCNISNSKTLSGVTYGVILICSLTASYERTQEPMPALAMGKGNIYQKALQSDSDKYLRVASFSPLAAQGQAIWVYIAKLHNGSWGTLTVSDIGQLRYHDSDGMTAIKAGKRKVALEVDESSVSINPNLVTAVDLNPTSGLFTLNFADNLDSDRCFVYVFGEHNGMLFRTTDCEEWNIEYRQLEYLTRMTGYTLSEVSIAAWTENPNRRIYSTPYKFSDLLTQKEL